MKERPILFSALMVRALLAGTKTQTRRIVKPQPKHWTHYLTPMWGTSPPPDPVDFGEPGVWREAGPDYPDSDDGERRCPYGFVGDRLWVRESWRTVESLDLIRPIALAESVPIHYDGDDSNRGRFREPVGRGRPGIHMPRWASRITLEVTEVRAQRLHDISEEDARAEGVEPVITERRLYPSKLAATVDERSYLRGFVDAWGVINGADSWQANPWVWAITFQCIEAP